MKKWTLEGKFKNERNWTRFGTYNDSRTPIKRAKELIKVRYIIKARVTEIEENTIYEEEVD